MQDKEITGWVRCPKCKSRNYYYEGFYIECRDCKYIQRAKIINGKLEDVYEAWREDNE